MMTSKIRKADAPESAEKAADLLKKGGVIICPTETLYGFSANALIVNAIRHVDTIKERKQGETYILLVKDMAMAKTFLLLFDRTAEKLAERFWPGPLTMVLPVAKESPLIHLASMGTLAVRVSPDKFLTRLFASINFPVISTSVNKSGKPPMTDPSAMEKDFKRDVDLILERGVLASKTPSTIVAIKNNTIQMIRKGVIPEEQIYGH